VTRDDAINDKNFILIAGAVKDFFSLFRGGEAIALIALPRKFTFNNKCTETFTVAYVGKGMKMN